MYEWVELRKKWEHEQVTVEQVLGQLILHGESHDVRLTQLQRQVATLEQSVAALTNRLAAATASASHRLSAQ